MDPGNNPISVTVQDEPNPPQYFEFQNTFRIGRSEECEVCIANSHVSRVHLEIALENGLWQVRDLKSSNGVFVSGVRVESLSVPREITVRLGIRGPFVALTPSQSVRPSAVPKPSLPRNASVASYVEHYFAPSSGPDDAAGEHTMMLRAAFSKVQKTQRHKWLAVVATLTLLVIAGAAFALIEHRRAAKQRADAEKIFYNMKSLDVDIANFERLALESNSDAMISQIRTYQQRRKEMEEDYANFLKTLKADNPKLSDRQLITLRVARIFGECDLNMPSGFQNEIDRYIDKWKSSGRLARDIALAKSRGYVKPITDELLAVDLPLQFFYLALQESDFDPYISGPPTRKGIAKGMWQFIPETAVKYGLHVGPLADLPRADPGDDRHHWEIETKAATRYMKDLYSTEAQGSGLLVMACYNWGEDQVLPLVRSLPKTPRDRNFWNLLAKYKDKLPGETYDYVFSIVSAAIIGEDPHLFGFDFDNPLVNPQ